MISTMFWPLLRNALSYADRKNRADCQVKLTFIMTDPLLQGAIGRTPSGVFDPFPGEIFINEPLFVEGLGLNSIGALELCVALRKRYGIRIESVTAEVKAHFANVRNLAQFIRTQQGARQ